jgi:hypothetical protein
MRLALAAMMMMAWAPLEAQRALPSRGELAAVEESMYNKLRRYDINAPLDVLGLPRGIYLPGYGAVFTAEVNIVQVAGISPFRPEIGPDEVARVKAAKLKRLPAVRDLMRQMLVDGAATLDRVPANEQVVLGFVLVHHSWEDRKGLPQMITMQAPKQALVNVATKRAGADTLAAALRVREE